MFVGLVWLTSNHMFGTGDFGINHPRDFWKFWNCPCFTWVISKFSKMHSGNLSQIAFPNMWLLVRILDPWNTCFNNKKNWIMTHERDCHELISDWIKLKWYITNALYQTLKSLVEANPSRQIFVPRTSRGRPHPTSPKDPIWLSRRRLDLTSRGRPNLTS